MGCRNGIGIIFALTTHLLLDVMIVHHAFYATGVLHHADKPYSLIRDSKLEGKSALRIFQQTITEEALF